MSSKKREAYDQEELGMMEDLKTNPDSPSVHIELGDNYMSKGMYDDAIREYRLVTSKHPNYADVHNRLGNAYADKGMHESAVDEYLAAIKVNPKYVEAHLNLGMAYTQLGMDARAIEEFKTVLEMEPNNQEAKLNLKVLGEAEGKGDSEHIISPDYADINARRGNDLMKAGKLDEAMAAFEEAIKQGARYADVLYNIGNIHEKKGQTEKALKYYRDALAINPLYALAKEAEKRIKGK